MIGDLMWVHKVTRGPILEDLAIDKGKVQTTSTGRSLGHFHTMYFLGALHMWAFLHLLVFCVSSALPDLQLPALPSNATVIDVGDV